MATLVQLFGDSGPWVDPDEIRGEFEASRDAWKAADAAVVYTQASLDAVRVLRNDLEMKSWRWACCYRSITGRAPWPGPMPTPVATPGVYPGIAPPLVQPTDIAGCVLWLTSDAGITVDAFNGVTAWADQSGLGNDVVWDLGKYEYFPNGFGSLPGLGNDVTQGTLKTTTRILPAGSARTVFVVARAHFIDDGAVFVNFQPARTTPAKSLALGIYNKGSLGTIHPASDLNTIDETLIAAPPSAFADLAQIYAYRWAGSSHAVQFAVAGEALNPLSGTALTTETGDNGLTIGHGYGAAHHGPYRGSIGTVIVYDSALSVDDYGRVCTWLANKFGL